MGKLYDEKRDKIKTIYCFTNLINNKKYIGSTINDPKIRYKQHMYYVKHKDINGKHLYPLYCAIREYGIKNFEFEILAQYKCSEEEIRQIEANYIQKFNCLVPNGYNQTINTLHPLNDINSYKKMSITKREKAKNVVEVDDNFNIIKIWRSIIDCAEDTNLNEKKIAAVCRGERLTTGSRKFCWLDPNNELIIPEYHRDLYKGKKNTTQIQSTSKKVAKININTNEIIQIYDTIALAARENNCDNSGISKVCRGLRNKCGGFKWKYVENL